MYIVFSFFFALPKGHVICREGDGRQTIIIINIRAVTRAGNGHADGTGKDVCYSDGFTGGSYLCMFFSTRTGK